MKVLCVETKSNKQYLHLDHVPSRKIACGCLEPLEYFISIDDLKMGMRNLYNIFIPSEMFKVRIMNNDNSSCISSESV